MRPLALLVLAEFLVIVLLAMLWLAGTSSAVAGAPSRTGGYPARPVTAADAAGGDLIVRGPCGDEFVVAR